MGEQSRSVMQICNTLERTTTRMRKDTGEKHNDQNPKMPQQTNVHVIMHCFASSFCLASGLQVVLWSAREFVRTRTPATTSPVNIFGKCSQAATTSFLLRFCWLVCAILFKYLSCGLSTIAVANILTVIVEC